VIAWVGEADRAGGDGASWLAHWGARVIDGGSVQQPVDAIVFEHITDTRPWADAIRAWRAQGQLRRLVVIEATGDLERPGLERGGLAAARGLPLRRLSSPFAPAELLASLTHTPGAGATFAPRGAEPQRPLAGLRVLMAEDNPVNRLLAETLLRQLGGEVTTAVDGLRALDVLGRQCFDLALMDIQMPGLDGSDVVQRWRRLEGAQDDRPTLPIIAMTAHAMVGDRERFEAQGFDGYVGKPFTRAGLLAEIARVCPSASRRITPDPCEQP
jgi:CheY-like chemotaxis protein